MLKPTVKHLPTHLLEVIYQLISEVYTQDCQFNIEWIDSSIPAAHSQPLVKYDLAITSKNTCEGSSIITITNHPYRSSPLYTVHQRWYIYQNFKVSNTIVEELLTNLHHLLVEHVEDLEMKKGNQVNGRRNPCSTRGSTSDSRRRHVQTPPHHTLPSLQDTINLVVEEYEQSLQQAHEEIERLSNALEQYQRYYEENERSRNHFGFSGQNDYRYSTESTNRDAELAETLRRVEEKLDKALEPKPKRESIFTKTQNKGQMPENPTNEMPPLKKPTKGGYTPTVEDPTATPIPPKAKRKYTRKNKEIVTDTTVIKATIRDTKPEYVSDIPLPEKPKK